MDAQYIYIYIYISIYDIESCCIPCLVLSSSPSASLCDSSSSCLVGDILISLGDDNVKRFLQVSCCRQAQEKEL